MDWKGLIARKERDRCYTLPSARHQSPLIRTHFCQHKHKPCSPPLLTSICLRLFSFCLSVSFSLSLSIRSNPTPSSNCGGSSNTVYQQLSALDLMEHSLLCAGANVIAINGCSFSLCRGTVVASRLSEERHDDNALRLCQQVKEL